VTHHQKQVREWEDSSENNVRTARSKLRVIHWYYLFEPRINSIVQQQSRYAQLANAFATVFGSGVFSVSPGVSFFLPGVSVSSRSPPAVLRFPDDGVPTGVRRVYVFSGDSDVFKEPLDKGVADFENKFNGVFAGPAEVGVFRGVPSVFCGVSSRSVFLGVDVFVFAGVKLRFTGVTTGDVFRVSKPSSAGSSISVEIDFGKPPSIRRARQTSTHTLSALCRMRASVVSDCDCYTKSVSLVQANSVPGFGKGPRPYLRDSARAPVVVVGALDAANQVVRPFWSSR
jgi:hypothetical protein